MQRIAFLAVCFYLFADCLQATDLSSIELKFSEMKDSERVYSTVVFSPDGKKIVVGSQYFVEIEDRVITQDTLTRIFDVESGKELQKWEGSFRAMTPDGKKIAVGKTGRVRDVRILDLDSGKELLKVDEAFSTGAFSTGFSPDGKKIIIERADNSMQETQIVDIESGKVLQKFEGISGLRFSPDGKTLLTSIPLYGSEKEIRILDAESGKELRQLEGMDMWGFSSGFSPDGKQIVTQSGTEESGPLTLIWDAETGKEVQRLEGFFWGFSLDGKKIVTLRDFPQPDTARIWDSQSGKELQKSEKHVNLEPSPVFSPDGKVFFPFGLYNIDTRKEWQGFGDTSKIGPVTCSPDGKKIVTVEDNKIVRILTVE